MNSQLVTGIEREIKEQGANVANINIFDWAHRGALDAVGRFCGSWYSM
jgi:hypothetical protein